MLQTNVGWLLCFSVLAENRAKDIEQSQFGSALSSASCSAQVALQRCPILCTSALSLLYLFIPP